MKARVDLPQCPLRERREGADRFHLVAEELDAERLASGRREDIDQAAAHRELPALLDALDALVARRAPVLGQRVDPRLVAGRDPERRRPRARRRIPSASATAEAQTSPPAASTSSARSRSPTRCGGGSSPEPCRTPRLGKSLPARRRRTSRRLGCVARVGVLGRAGRRAAAELVVQRREQQRQRRLRDTSARDDFVFDNQMLAQAVMHGARIGEISCPTRYFPEASSINFRRSAIYGLGVLKTSLDFRLAKWGIHRSPVFQLVREPASPTFGDDLSQMNRPRLGSGAWRIALLPALLAFCVARLWLMPLPSSFWLDEMVTVFVVGHGSANPSLAAAPQVANSIYYSLPRAAQALFGTSEIAFRLPSVLAMALALFFVALLARRLIHPRAAWLAVFACLALSGFNYQAADARPYALGTCIASACIWSLLRWLDSARWRDALLFVCLAALLLRVHLLYWPMYLAFAAYALARLLKRETRVSGPMARVVTALVVLTNIPEAQAALTLLREAKSHVIVAPPSLHAFEHELRWLIVLICGAVAWLLSKLWGGPPGPRPAPWPASGGPVDTNSARESGPGGLAQRAPRTSGSAPQGAALTLILAWWLCPPICLFAFSWFTGDSVFLRRYLSEMLPGVALAATAAATYFLPAGCLNRMAAALGAGALLFLGQWSQLWPAHEHSDWRGAAIEVNHFAGPATPVICPSPFIEAKSPAWRPDYHLPGFLYSYLPVYPIMGAVDLFPYATSPEAESYAATEAAGPLTASRSFVIYGFNQQVNYWRDWFAVRPELAGWKQTSRPFGDVEVVRFFR